MDYFKYLFIFFVLVIGALAEDDVEADISEEGAPKNHVKRGIYGDYYGGYGYPYGGYGGYGGRSYYYPYGRYGFYGYPTKYYGGYYPYHNLGYNGYGYGGFFW